MIFRKLFGTKYPPPQVPEEQQIPIEVLNRRIRAGGRWREVDAPPMPQPAIPILDPFPISEFQLQCRFEKAFPEQYKAHCNALARLQRRRREGADDSELNRLEREHTLACKEYARITAPFLYQYQMATRDRKVETATPAPTTYIPTDPLSRRYKLDCCIQCGSPKRAISVNLARIHPDYDDVNPNGDFSTNEFWLCSNECWERAIEKYLEPRYRFEKQPLDDPEIRKFADSYPDGDYDELRQVAGEMIESWKRRCHDARQTACDKLLDRLNAEYERFTDEREREYAEQEALEKAVEPRTYSR